MYAMILCSNNWKSNEGKVSASGLLLSVVLDRASAESKNCLSQNHKLFGYFLTAKSIKKEENILEKTEIKKAISKLMALNIT